MKVYNVILIPYGDLRGEMKPTILGTYKDKEEAKKRALYEYQEDNRCGEWVAFEEDIKDFDDYLQVFWKYIENYISYYEIHIMESEIKES